jgi:hypothetical protein
MKREKLVFAAMLLVMLAGTTRFARAQNSVLASAPSVSLPLDSNASAPSYISLPSTRDKTSSFSRWSVNFKASTLGAGGDIATSLGKHFALRGSINALDFDYPFSIDGVTYDSRFHLRSGGVSLDWFPTHGGLRVSPGVLYFKNNLSAISSVPPGKYFELGSQGFINSIDDPLNGTASVVFPRRVAPMLTIGFRSIVPSRGEGQRRLSFPAELGLAYTGAAKIDVTLNGTACTNEGCFTFADNAEAQDSLKAEIQKLNNRLESYPVYPIVSLGVAYRF